MQTEKRSVSRSRGLPFCYLHICSGLKVGDLNQGRTVKFWEVKLDQRTVEYRVSEQSFEKRIQHDGRLMSLKDTEQFAKRGQYWPRFCIGLSLDARSTN